MTHQSPLTEIHLRSRGRGIDISAFGTSDCIVIERHDEAFLKIQHFVDTHPKEHIFFAFSYELKDGIEHLQSENQAYIPTPLALLFTSPTIVKREDKTWEILQGKLSTEDVKLLEAIDTSHAIEKGGDLTQFTADRAELDREEYLLKIQQIQAHIQKGDIYEMNFCTESKYSGIDIDPHQTFGQLLTLTNAPYSVFLRFKELCLLCSSPESYLEKKADRLISRPIKGTRKRHSDPRMDNDLKEELGKDTKERAENIMITDLVRNDLSKVAAKNSVSVKELCEVYSFDTVHQMISTVECRIADDLPITEVFKATFPMGSMTGAPKVSAMELIEDIEDFRRGWFSGCIGYIDPNGDMNSNVIIRSITYDRLNGLASIAAGGAITSLSIPEQEYEERMLKVEAVTRALMSASKSRTTDQE